MKYSLRREIGGILFIHIPQESKDEILIVDRRCAPGSIRGRIVVPTSLLQEFLKEAGLQTKEKINE